jgi:hypothetical protein
MWGGNTFSQTFLHAVWDELKLLETIVTGEEKLLFQ